MWVGGVRMRRYVEVGGWAWACWEWERREWGTTVVRFISSNRLLSNLSPSSPNCFTSVGPWIQFWMNMIIDAPCLLAWRKVEFKSDPLDIFTQLQLKFGRAHGALILEWRHSVLFQSGHGRLPAALHSPHPSPYERDQPSSASASTMPLVVLVPILVLMLVLVLVPILVQVY